MALAQPTPIISPDALTSRSNSDVMILDVPVSPGGFAVVDIYVTGTYQSLNGHLDIGNCPFYYFISSSTNTILKGVTIPAGEKLYIRGTNYTVPIMATGLLYKSS